MQITSHNSLFYIYNCNSTFTSVVDILLKLQCSSSDALTVFGPEMGACSH